MAFSDTADITTGSDVLAAVDKLLPEIGARSAEIEANGDVPEGLMRKIHDTGTFRMFVPKTHGGIEIDIPTAIEIIARIASADGSAGWTAMICASSSLLVSRLPRTLYDKIFQDSPEALFSGVAAPKGRGEKVDGGYRVTGRWGFSSGCRHADWLLGTCVITEDGVPLRNEFTGAPLTRSAVMPADAWTIEDTWHVLGMRGTGSNHTALNDVFVPEEQMFDFFGSGACVPGPLYDAAHVWTPLQHAAVALGIAERSRDELITGARSAPPSSMTGKTVADRQLFLHGLAYIDAQVKAMRASLMNFTESRWETALTGEPMGLDAMIEAVQLGSWLTKSASDMVRWCFELAGPQAVYSNSVIQRNLRDIQVANQHALINQESLIDVGKQLLDLPSAPLAGLQ
ncbi:acyl-CoA dehydrogenase family protein [Streptomyces sp. NPDC051985]|uniref:acyl-CoA dehydrogenase family protein n=1 Tax=Streptomyces sp. NPDC051985 TaxID=3155807 RepID=UPI00341F9520